MKKIFLLMITIMLIIPVLFNYTASSEDAPETPTKFERSDFMRIAREMMSPNASWTDKDTIEMSNYMNEKSYCHSGKWELRRDFNNEDGNCFRTTNLTAGEYNILEKNAKPAYIYSDDLTAIYLRRDEQNITSIQKIWVTGGAIETIVDSKTMPTKGFLRFLQIYNDQLYFSVINSASEFLTYYTPIDKSANTITGAFYRVDMDGNNLTLILDKPVLYPYFIQDKLYYQDYTDRLSLHMCDPDGTNDMQFLDDICYEYITDGEKIYYISYSGNPEWDENNHLTNGQDLKRILKIYNLSDGTSTETSINPGMFAHNGESIFYSNYYDSDRLYKYNLQTGNAEALYFEDYLWDFYILGKDLMCINSAPDNRMESIILANTDGKQIRVYE